MALTRQNVQTRLTESADRLDKLSGDFLHLAEQSSIESLQKLRSLKKDADLGKLSYLSASEAAAGMASAMQENLETLEAGQSAFDLGVHQDECDRMIEALLAMRGQARRTAQALGRHLSRTESDEGEAAEARG